MQIYFVRVRGRKRKKKASRSIYPDLHASLPDDNSINVDVDFIDRNSHM